MKEVALQIRVEQPYKIAWGCSLLSSALLPETLLRALREEAERRGTTPEALMVRLLLDIVSEEEKPRVLLEAARNSLEHAKPHRDKGEYHEAFKRLWVSVLLGLEAYALSRGVAPGSGLDWYWDTASDAASQLGDVVLDAFYAGLAAFIASREELSDETHFEAISKRVESLLVKLGESLGA